MRINIHEENSKTLLTQKTDFSLFLKFLYLTNMCAFSMPLCYCALSLSYTHLFLSSGHNFKFTLLSSNSLLFHLLNGEFYYVADTEDSVSSSRWLCSIILWMQCNSSQKSQKGLLFGPSKLFQKFTWYRKCI